MNRFYYTFMDVPFKKKSRYATKNIFWNVTNHSKAGRYLSGFLGKRIYLNNTEYGELMGKTKLYINTLSPMGLVSPRFFECMASGALVFCEESELYKNIFPDEIYVTFRSDLSDFDKKLFHYLEAEEERNRITEKAHLQVKKNHTWEIRITNLLFAIKKISASQIIV